MTGAHMLARDRVNRVAEVMDEVRLAGITTISIAADEPGGGG